MDTEINKYIPEEYKLFNTWDVVAINDDKELDQDYPNLEWFEGGLKLPKIYKKLMFIHINGFYGDLRPLRDAPIKNISMNNFTGSIGPLQSMLIKKLYLYSFNGDLSPLRGSLIKKIWADGEIIIN